MNRNLNSKSPENQLIERVLQNDYSNSQFAEKMKKRNFELKEDQKDNLQ